MLKWSLRVIVTIMFIGLVGTCWWVYSLPKQTAAAQTAITFETVATFEADDIAPSDVDVILAGSGYDEDGGILNEDNNK